MARGCCPCSSRLARFRRRLVDREMLDALAALAHVEEFAELPHLSLNLVVGGVAAARTLAGARRRRRLFPRTRLQRLPLEPLERLTNGPVHELWRKDGEKVAKDGAREHLSQENARERALSLLRREEYDDDGVKVPRERLDVVHPRVQRRMKLPFHGELAPDGAVTHNAVEPRQLSLTYARTRLAIQLELLDQNLGEVSNQERADVERPHARPQNAKSVHQNPPHLVHALRIGRKGRVPQLRHIRSNDVVGE
mmetsp:Transcript_25604/g.84284  ORF Transcript_25604/g.84284 Transcript_25604/m.84284 type:complete len:252 (-) Transcript_25604:381-1136(-)